MEIPAILAEIFQKIFAKIKSLTPTKGTTLGVPYYLRRPGLPDTFDPRISPRTQKCWSSQTKTVRRRFEALNSLKLTILK